MMLSVLTITPTLTGVKSICNVGDKLVGASEGPPPKKVWILHSDVF